MLSLVVLACEERVSVRGGHDRDGLGVVVRANRKLLAPALLTTAEDGNRGCRPSTKHAKTRVKIHVPVVGRVAESLPCLAVI